jgi:hypothetical protein
MVLMSMVSSPPVNPPPVNPLSTAPAAVAGPPYVPDPVRVEKLRRQMTHGLSWRLFMLAKLPLGLFAGIRVRELDVARCVATVPYGWRSTNPFQSTYFAALAMAAELSTGALALMAARSAPRSVALLIVDLDARFEKKAVATTAFTCDQGDRLFAAVGESLASGEAVTARVETIGRAPDGEVVAGFHVTWSFKVRGASRQTPTPRGGPAPP